MPRILNPNEIMFTAFEPLQTHRFVFNIEGIPAYLVKKATAPGVSTTPIKLDHINTYRKIAGRYEWRDMELALYAPIAPSGQQAVMEWMRLHYESTTGRAGYSDMYKKDLSLELIGPVGDVVSEWIVKGALIQASNFGELDFSNAAALEITLTISCDYVILNF